MKHIRPFGVGAALIVLVIAAAWLQSAWSQQPGVKEPGRTQPPAPSLTVDCRDLLTDFRVLHADMIALDEKLAARISAMQSAEEANRLDAIQGAVEEIAGQRRQVLEVMKGVHQKLMVHLMDHLLLEDGGDTLKACPVMNAIKHDQLPSGVGPPTGELDR